MTKYEIRSKIRRDKKKLTAMQIQKWSDSILEKFCKTKLYEEASVIYCYVSYNEEVRTNSLIKRALRDGKQVAVPKVMCKETHEMNFYYINSLSDLKEGYQGILEPEEDDSMLAKEDGIMILPGLAFDNDGNRLGYGGGFYDCFLQSHLKLNLVSFAFDFQVLSELPHERHDRKIDHLFTQTKDYHFKKRSVSSWSI